MISIVAERFLDGAMRVSASGHAGYAPRGKDIVCAGVSALMFGCIYYLSDKYGIRTECDKYGDVLVIDFPVDASAEFELLRASLRLMYRTYPEYVYMEEKN